MYVCVKSIGKTPEDVTSAAVQQPLMTGTHASGEITAGTSNTQPQPTVKRWTEKLQLKHK